MHTYLHGILLFRSGRISRNLREFQRICGGILGSVAQLCCSVPGSGNGAFNYDFNPERPVRDLIQEQESAQAPKNDYRHSF